MLRADKQTEAEVMSVLHRFFEAYTARDLSTAMGTLVQDPDVVFLGAGQDERRVGPSDARTQMERDLSQAEEVSFRDEWHHVSASGDVAWMAADGTLSWKAGGTQMSAPSRISGVFVKQGSKWLIAQFHFSFMELRQAEGQSFPSQ